MQRSEEEQTATALRAMLSALKLLDSLKNASERSLSNSAKIISNIKQLQTAYHGLDDVTREKIDKLLAEKHAALLAELRKKGSRIAKAPELAGVINDDLAEEFKQFVYANTSTPSRKHSGSDDEVQTTAIPTHEQSDLSEFDAFSTTRVNNNATSDDDQLNIAIASAGSHQDPSSYIASALFGKAATEKVDPLTTCVDALDALRKAKTNKETMRASTKVEKFDEAYDAALVSQIYLLEKNKPTIENVGLDDINRSKLNNIRHHLSKVDITNKQSMLSAAEAISRVVDLELINALRKLQPPQQPTPRPDFK